MFLLTVFVLGQFILSREISGKDEVLDRLNNQINELTQLLALEKGGKQDLEDSVCQSAGAALPWLKPKSQAAATARPGAAAYRRTATRQEQARCRANLPSRGTVSAQCPQSGRVAQPADRSIAVSQIAAVEEALQVSRIARTSRARPKSRISAADSMSRWRNACRN
jgi:chemotaxis protein MotB